MLIHRNNNASNTMQRGTTMQGHLPLANMNQSLTEVPDAAFPPQPINP
jgi:hypothetical protein